MVGVIVETAVTPVAVNLKRHRVGHVAPPGEALASAVSDATCRKVFGKVVAVEPRVLPGSGQLAHIHDGCHTGSLDHFSEVLEFEVGVAHGENAHVANATRQAGTPASASGYRASAGGRIGRTGGGAGRTFNAFAPAFARHQSYLRPSVPHGPFG